MRYVPKSRKAKITIGILVCGLIVFSSLTYYYISEGRQIAAEQLAEERAKQAELEKKQEQNRLEALRQQKLQEEKAAEKRRKAKEADEKKKSAEKEAQRLLNQSLSAQQKQNSTSTHSAHRDPSRIDVVVNKKNPLIPIDYVPSVATVSCAGNGSTTISTQATNDFAALCSAAKNAGVPLATSSSYRSYSTQVSTYNYWVSQENGNAAAADKYSARPGYSEHQTGLSVDFQVPGGASLSNFTGTPQQKWLSKHGWKYGWIQRYTSSNSSDTGYVAESWHYRYIGRSIAKAYANSGSSSLESYWGVPGGGY